MINSDSIILTAGIGDFAAIDFFLSSEDKKRIKTIFYSTMAAKSLKEIIINSNCYSNKINHIDLWDVYKDFLYFVSKQDVKTKLILEKKFVYNEDFEKAIDLSILKVFPYLNPNDYYSFSFSEKLCNIEKLDFQYICVNPNSINELIDSPRNFSLNDWDVICELAKIKKYKIIVLGIGDFFVPIDNNILNYVNKISLSESIEILKFSNGYWGIDSCFSVFASKFLSSNCLIIKSISNWCYKASHIYYAPHKDFSFITKDLKTIKKPFTKKFYI